MLHPRTAFLFDLDGTLVDSVYQHVLAWKEALESEGIQLSVWRIHRRIGMSGGLLTNMLLRETGLELDAGALERLRRAHADAYNQPPAQMRPLPGARALLATLTSAASPGPSPPAAAWRPRARRSPSSVSIPKSPVVTRDQVQYAKPDPDLFLAAAERLGVPIESSRWWATASGTCSPPAAPAPWASASSPAATARKSSNARAPTASTKTPPTC